MSAPSPSALKAEFEALLVALRQIQTVNYSQTAALTVLIYDLFLTFSDEVELIWKSRWSLPKFLYLFARYYALVHVIIVVAAATFLRPSLPFCRFYFWYYAIGGLPIFSFMTGFILLLRIHSLYGRTPKMLAFLLTLLITELGIEYYVTFKSAIETASAAFNAPPGVPLTGCITQPFSYKYTIPAWVICDFTAAMFFGLTLYKFIRLFMDHWKVTKERNLGFLSPFLTAFFRDGVIYFLLPLIVTAICTATVLGNPGPLEGVAISWSIAIYSISSCRLVMGLREAASRENSTPTWVQTMSAMVYNDTRLSVPPADV